MCIIVVLTTDSDRRTRRPPDTRRDSKLKRQDRILSENPGHFVLYDHTQGDGVFYISQRSTILEDVTELDTPTDTQSRDSSTDIMTDPSDKNAIHLTSGVHFVAGHLEFSFTPLPLDLTFTLRMFVAANRGNLVELKSVLESSVNSEVTLPHVFVTPTDDSQHHQYTTLPVPTEQGVDVNVEYLKPSYGDDSMFSQFSNRRRSSAQMLGSLVPSSPLSPQMVSPSTSQQPHKLVLHIAIEKRDLEMVKFLLDIGADVSL